MSILHRARPVALLALAALAGLSLTPVAAASAATTLATDVVVSGHQTSASSTVVSPAFSSAQGGELLLAFVTADGPAIAGSETFSAVTGAGLTWQLRKRANAQYGTAEIWQAVSNGVISNATVSATHTGTGLAAITVVSFTGADTAAAGAVAGASAATGAPSATLTTTRTGSWLWGSVTIGTPRRHARSGRARRRWTKTWRHPETRSGPSARPR
ncbi:hypothetical protein [Leifsonia shinshuensis]|uniref:WxL domain-containing protein n=1 Tax=Leifsonia shinshuensis TaxID=150026 RepID=A0A7G6YCG1_9MICO|nr:hypothetical protein [Leifsonia shinshuensis]QNE36176.1 hypothetical protein F1C12_14345 [Leifsonia shinshuensis]